MEKVLITGVNGLLGQKCVSEFEDDFEIIGLDIQDKSLLKNAKTYIKGDITQRKNLKALLVDLHPHYIINTAAYTNVDASETNKELCWKINVEGIQNLIYGARKINAAIIHLSTDYIFDGKTGPYREDETPSPLGYYGKSKLASENTLAESKIPHAILRTMVMYGIGVNTRPNFTTWVIDKLKLKENINVVTDQFGNPTLADDLARAIKRLINMKKWGLFNYSGNEYLDRYSFALKIAATFDLDIRLITPTTTEGLHQAALRPLNSGFILDKVKTELGIQPLDIDESLKIFKKQYKKYK
jgi:dTDP-4-dehydrorhamnose reductase